MGQPTQHHNNQIDPLFRIYNPRNRTQNRLSRREMREQQITSLQNYIQGGLQVIKRLLKRERVYPIFRFNDLTTEAKRRFVYHFKYASHHATVYHMKLPKLFRIMEMANPIIWQSWQEYGLENIQTRYEINRLSSWIYNYELHPEMLTPLEAMPQETNYPSGIRNSFGIEIDRRVSKNRYDNDCKEFTDTKKRQIQLWLDTGEEVSLNSLTNENVTTTNEGNVFTF